MVVQQFMNGQTLVKINDEYCRNTTQEEVNEILRKIGEIAYPELYAKAQREYEEKQKCQKK